MGAVTSGKGGTPTLRLMRWNIPVRYLRIWMMESSNTCDTHGAQDKRNCVGYAINELYIGTVSSDDPPSTRNNPLRPSLRATSCAHCSAESINRTRGPTTFAIAPFTSG